MKIRCKFCHKNKPVTREELCRKCQTYIDKRRERLERVNAHQFGDIRRR